ncbi:MAG: hypothetical protein ACFFG0_12895 [Candidatus Thorarchaeota archaeon]
MLSKQIYTEHVVSLRELFPNFAHEFLESFKNVGETEITHGMYLDFEISEREHQHKKSPILRLARPEDAKKIVEIYKELYNGTYPYKEMEDVKEVRKLIKNPNVQWIIYQDPSYNIAGCITFVLDFDNKRGYIRGFMLKKKYQGYIDITKAMIGSMLCMIHNYTDTIYNWYVENRTAHAKSQYSMWVCGIAPIAFYPNKDVFLGKVESDLMQILYDERALTTLRNPNRPKIIPDVKSCYDYSDTRYNLGTCAIESPDIVLDDSKLKVLRKCINKHISKDKFGYETIILTLKNSESYFRFLYTPQVQNFEKTNYKVKNLEELQVFAEEFVHCREELGVRYCEVFVSAYKPEHQQIFYNAGLSSKGYVPSWKYSSKKKKFNDHILFSVFDGTINKNINLIDEGRELVKILARSFQYNKVVDKATTKLERKSQVKILQKVSSNRPFKMTLLGAMITYLALLFSSLSIVIVFDFNILIHTISDLGKSLFTPVRLLFDGACIIAGLITIPYNFFIKKSVIYSPAGNSTKAKLLKSTSYLGIVCGVIGGVGYIFVGIFSLERAGPYGMYHGLCAAIAFFGFVFSILCFSLHAIFEHAHIPKGFGICGVVLPLLFFVVNFIFATPLLEWLLLFSILIHICPLNYWSVTI